MLSPDTILQNRYRIVRQLGQGGMGTVYEAKALRLNTTVALKETHFTDEKLRKQFEREAQLLARLRHPAMTRVIDHFTEGNGQFLVMDYVEGEDLWEMLRTRGAAFQPEKVLEWADQLLDALCYLHKQDPPIIHRDIKPQNLKLSDTGQIILLDFGLAKGFAGQISRVTTSGSIFGYTPNYAPLEQIQGTGTDARSDLYSLAATLYHLITGVVPPDIITRVTATTDGQTDPLRSPHELNKEVPHPIADVLIKAMAIGRTQRFITASEMRQALRDAEKSVASSILKTIPYIPIIQAPPPLPPKLNTPSPITQLQPKGKSNTRLWIVVSISILISIGIIVGTIRNYDKSASSNQTQENAVLNSNSANYNSFSTTVNTATPQLPTTVQVRLIQTENSADIWDNPVHNTNIAIRAGEMNFNQLTNNSGVALFDAIPCDNEITITAFHPGSQEDAIFRRQLGCNTPLVDLGVISNKLGGDLVLERRKPHYMEYDAINGVWRFKDGRIIPDKQIERRSHELSTPN